MILDAVKAPPRLLAHLALVHEVAYELVEGLITAWPALPIDREAVLIGAATHDVGKVAHPEELQGPGRLHENDGPALLTANGLSPDLARFARTHAQWAADQDAGLEDLIVALANVIWIGNRNQHLEDTIINRLAAFSGEPLWSVFATFDELEIGILEDAGRRLAIYKNVVQDEEEKQQQGS